MNNIRKNRAEALKMVGIGTGEVKNYLKSAKEYYVQYRGRSSKFITSEILDKFRKLADIRRKMGIEIAGVIFEDNLTAIFIFYVNDNPEDAWYEKNSFLSVNDFTKELNRQVSGLFSPDMSEGKKIFYKKGIEMEIVMFK